MSSCSPLPLSLPLAAPVFRDESFHDPRAHTIAIGDLPDVLVRETQAPRDSRDDAPNLGRRGELRLKRYRIHGGNQPRKEERYRSRDIEVKRKIAAAMNASELPIRIKALKQALGLNQKDFGALCGVKQVAVSQWENGERTPSAKTLLRMSELAPTSDRQWWRDRAAEQTGVDVVVSSTSGGFEIPDLSRKVPLIRDPSKVGKLGSVVAVDIERILSFSPEFFPDGGKIEAVRILPNSADLIAVVDVSRQDAENLIGKMVAVRTALGIEVRWLAREDGMLFLLPFQPGQTVKPMRYKGEWSIVGAVRWIGDDFSAHGRPQAKRPRSA